MSEAPLMLGVSGLRGIVGKSLTPDIAMRFAQAFGGWLKERAKPGRLRWLGTPAGQPLVIVGADGRAGFEPLRDAVVRGLQRAECFPIDIGIAMTPTVAVATDHDEAEGALILTASHNPQEWNGIKCLFRSESQPHAIGACAPAAAIAEQIVQRFRAGEMAASSPQPAGLISCATESDTVGMHIGPVIAEIGDAPQEIRSRRYRVVLDSVNGAGRFAGRVLLAEALECDLIHEGTEDSGLFPHPPEPTRENLASLCGIVKEARADIGFAQDPDADRLAIIDELGSYIGEEYTLALAAESLLSNPQSAIRNPQSRLLVTNLSTSRMLDDIAGKHGGRVLRTPVGEANVVEVMKRQAAAGHQVVLGGEGNGGVIWPKVTYVRDSLSAMALVLALMARTGKTVSQLVAAIPAYAIEKRKVDLARKEDAAPAIAKISAAYRAHRLDTQDGIRVDLAHGPLAGRAWLHIRASNTEPIMRLIAEAPTPEGAQSLLDEAARTIAS